MIIGGILYFGSCRTIRDMGYDVLGASFFPKLGAVFLIFFGLCLFINSLLGIKEVKKKIKMEEKGRIVMFLGTLAFYVYIFSKVGFIFSTMFFIIASYIMLSKSRGIRNIVVGVVFSATTSYLLWLIFTKALNVVLP